MHRSLPPIDTSTAANEAPGPAMSKLLVSACVADVLFYVSGDSERYALANVLLSSSAARSPLAMILLMIES